MTGSDGTLLSEVRHEAHFLTKRLFPGLAPVSVSLLDTTSDLLGAFDCDSFEMFVTPWARDPDFIAEQLDMPFEIALQVRRKFALGIVLHELCHARVADFGGAGADHGHLFASIARKHAVSVGFGPPASDAARWPFKTRDHW